MRSIVACVSAALLALAPMAIAGETACDSSASDGEVILVLLDKHGNLDVLTLDPSLDPVVIVEALEGDVVEASLDLGTLLIIDSTGDEVLVEILD